MATYHLTAKIGKKGKAAAHAAYIAREGKYSGRARYEDLEATASGNMPEWAAHNAAHFWTAADGHERVNGSAYREIEVALPRELTPAQRLGLVQAFIGQEIGDKHAYQFAIHTPKAALEKADQPHAHIMYSERTMDGIARDPWHYFKRHNAKHPEKGGAKKFSGGKSAVELKAELLGWRERWAALQNAHLEKHGHTDRVDHRSLKAQGIAREPEQHLGAIGVNRLNAHDISALLERRAAEGELERAQRGVSLLDLSGDLKKAKAERLGASLKSYRPLFEAVAQKAAEDGFDERQRAAILAQAKETLIKNIESGAMPPTNTKTRQEFEATAKQAEGRQPTLPQGELAEQTLRNLIEAERQAWRKNEEKRLLEQAEQSRQAAWKLKAQEPKKPLLGLFATDQWKSDMAFWERDLQKAIDQHHAYKKQAQDTLNGNSKQEDWHRVAFHEQAERRLTTEHPRLAQALMEKRQADRQQAAQATAKAAADRAADQAVAGFKKLAIKREGKFLGYGDSGKNWAALPGDLKAAIEHYNQQPASARGNVLERMRRDYKREPALAEKLTQQLELGKDRGIVR